MPRTNNKHNPDGSAFKIERKNLTQKNLTVPNNSNKHATAIEQTQTVLLIRRRRKLNYTFSGKLQKQYFSPMAI